jgi:2,5-dihydroxypyridine 5,6-dioxygenase
MLRDRIERRWVEAFCQTFSGCAIAPGDPVAILSETQSREVNVRLAELALLELKARPFHLVLPTPKQIAPVPIRSTGASHAIQHLGPAVQALAASTVVIDCTVEGLLHAPELPDILKGGARVLMVSNEHPDALERTVPTPELEGQVKLAARKAKAASVMKVTSEAGTRLQVDLADAPVAGVWGTTQRPGTVTHWPAGLVVIFPKAHSVRGTLVLDAGDANLTFKRYLERPVTLQIEDDYVTRIEGEGTDAELMRRYFAAWDDPEAYAVSHVGWGMNPRARYEALAMYDQRDTNGTELRAFAGNFLYSTGANEFAGRHTLGHFDLPLRGCDVWLDDEQIIAAGVLQGELAGR